jgi:Polyphosphate kinase
LLFRTGVKDRSENIVVKSIIERFLEHFRIYCFSNGTKEMPNRNAKVYILQPI